MKNRTMPVTGADFTNTWLWGFTKEQLYSTASYQAKDLQGIGLGVSDHRSRNRHAGHAAKLVRAPAAIDRLGYNDLSGWDFSGQNLSNAYLFGSTLTNANLAGATVTGVSFYGTTGFTQEQLASTSNYQAKNLQGIGLDGIDLNGWDLSGQNLTNADLVTSLLNNADLSGANLSNAELRFSTSSNRKGATYQGRLGD